MSKFLNIPNGDYRIKVQEGGDIVLDTGTDTGTVTITGDLIVQGEQTTVNTTELDIEDNLIVLNNSDSPGSGIGGIDQYSGIQIFRGTGGDAAFLVYDDLLTDPVTANTVPGLWRFGVGDIRGSNELKGIYINSISTGGDELVIRTIDEPITVEVSVNADPDGGYSTLLTEDKHITNKKYVDDAISTAFATVFLSQIGDGTVSISSVTVLDEETTGNPSTVEVAVDGISVANFYDNRVELGDLRFSGTQIEPFTSNEDLILSAPGTGSVRIDDTIHINSVPGIDDIILSPAIPGDGVKIYTRDEAQGKTGIYFVNQNETRDELVSKSRSLLFSMLF